jgi:hypothetical protein
MGGGHTWPWAIRYLSILDALANSLREFWYRRPIDLNSDGVIFCGHTGWKAAAKLGLTRVPGHVSWDQAVQTTGILRRPPVETARLRWNTMRVACWPIRSSNGWRRRGWS